MIDHSSDEITTYEADKLIKSLDEALGDIALMLGKDDEAKALYERSKVTIQKMIDAFKKEG